MVEKAGRNDPCPCGSGKKYKQCCLKKDQEGGVKKKFKASLLTERKPIDLMERTFGDAIHRAKEPPQPLSPEQVKDVEKGHLEI